METMEKAVYLRPNALVEPLFNRWHAWVYLISPVTAAMYTANAHLKIMQSFVAAPQVHVAALKNPAMVSGPFINYDAGRVGDVKALIEKTRRERGDLLELAQAVQGLELLLAKETEGYSLEGLYESVPEGLKGLVELTYDTLNNPSARYIEGLAYKSPYYNKGSQSVLLSLIEGDQRTLVFGSPRLDGPGYLHLDVPFDDPALDELFRMRYEPAPLGRVREALGVRDEDLELFASFFTEEGPRRGARYDGEGVRVRYFGHACVLIETRETSVLVDPVISYEYPADVERYTYADLPETIDYLLLTHHHQDHCLLETLLQLRHKVRHILVPRSNAGALTDPSLRTALREIGFPDVREVDDMESVRVAGGEITALPFLGEHGDLNIRTKAAYLVRLGGASVLLAADSNNLEPRLYKYIHDAVGQVDLLFLGMECDGAPFSWVYGPLITKAMPRKVDQSRRLDGSNYEKAMRLVEELGPRHVYVYAMGQEPWLSFVMGINYTPESRPLLESDRLVESCRGRGMVSERLFGKKELLL